MKNQYNESKKYRVYGVIGMVGVFLIGALVGFILNGTDRPNNSIMTKEQCEFLTQKMSDAINYDRYEEIGQLNKIYSENCLGRNFEQPQQKVEEQKLQKTTCEKIESLLVERLLPVDASDSESHVENAKIFATLSEKGCPENTEDYKTLAKQELEIARALNDDSLDDKQESVEIVETYKRLQMQAEAERMIEKAKKLTNPAIDFIIQLEKIIEE
ncbi:MAG: hypothetical protein IKF41_04070 [Alphaproteobacteria bacterium]|nr:hypothetical protein [Alphaproteobacteria bacterium]